MRLANVEGRATVVTTEGGADVHDASGARLPSDPDRAVRAVADVATWWAAASGEVALDPSLSTESLAGALHRLGPPVPNPQQVFAVGLNYASHGAETGLAIPDEPMVFTKFPSAVGGPGAEVVLPNDTVDWEVEMVAVVGAGGRNIAEADALDALAGYCVGQDLSERTLQMANTPPQFSLAKSYPNFAPTGPWLTTLDELDDPLDLAIGCRVGDEVLQASRTRHMVFDVPTIVAYVSAVCELRPGDLIFTGTPEGVGIGLDPPRYLEPGQVLTSTIEGLGSIVNSCVAS